MINLGKIFQIGLLAAIAAIDVSSAQIEFMMNEEQNFQIALLILIFGVIVILAEFVFAFKMQWNSSDMVRFIGLTFIVTLTVVVIFGSKGLEPNLITAVIGFLGIIAGYLAGSKEKGGSH